MEGNRKDSQGMRVKGCHKTMKLTILPFIILLFFINCQQIMSSVADFNHLSFQQKVQDALTAVERTLELERSPRLAEEVDHTYGAKYELVNLTKRASCAGSSGELNGWKDT